MRRRFEGRRVIVTGGAQGIGRAIVDAFLAEGASVLAVDVREQQLAAMTSLPGVETLAVDLEDAEAVATVVPAASTRLGGLDVLVNCAAVQPDQPALDVTRADLDQSFAINVRARSC
jgi:NAD(P)-dependent dehydrogenase (short-subunit alcohol dehydrogenase family)